MTFDRFADLMEKIGFKENEPVTPVFKLNKKDIEYLGLRNSYLRTTGSYRVVSIWSTASSVAFRAKKDGSGDKLFPVVREEVAFWVKKDGNSDRLFPVFSKEVDFLAKRKKFKKN